MDIDGFIDGTFNTSFLKLNPVEQEKNLALAKKVPFAKTNKNLKEYKFSDDQRNPDSMWKLLMGMRACGLKNDALMETFYEIIGEHYQADEDYAIYVFHDRYDIPVKGLDHIRQGESERMYEYILCVICPLSGEYEPGDPGDRCPFYCHSSGQRQHIFSIDHNLFPPALCLSPQISAYLDSFLFVSNIFCLSTSEILLSYPLCQSSKH